MDVSRVHSERGDIDVPNFIASAFRNVPVRVAKNAEEKGWKQEETALLLKAVALSAALLRSRVVAAASARAVA